METLYLIAPNYKEAQYWAAQTRLPKSMWKFVYDETTLRGTHYPEVALVGQWHQRDDMRDIAITVQLAQGQIVDLLEWASAHLNNEAFLSSEGRAVIIESEMHQRSKPEYNPWRKVQ